VFDKYIEEMALSCFSWPNSANDPDSGIVERPQSFDYTAGIRRAQRNKSKGRNRQCLEDNVIDMFVAKAVANNEQDALVSDGTVLKLTKQVGVRISETARESCGDRRR